MRRHRSLLQKQLAVLLGYTDTRRLEHYERGALPPLPIAMMLEIALGVRLQELYPSLYRECQELILKRAQHLPDRARDELRSRLLKEDIPA